MAANMMQLLMMSSMASSCSSSVSSPMFAALFFWSRVAAFFGGLLGKLNPFKAVGKVGGLAKKGVGAVVGVGKKGVGAVVGVGKKGVRAVGGLGKKGVRAVGKGFKKVGRVFKKPKFKRPKIGRCFAPETPIQLRSGKMVLIKNLKLGDTLINCSVVDAVMKIKNYNDPYYKIYSPELKRDIYVTGKHYIQDGVKYVQVKNLPNAKPTDKIDDVVSCLVTSDHKIPVGNMVFWDWEDNLIPTKTNVDAIIKKIRHRKTVAQ